MRCNYIREKKYQCGDDYMAVGVFSIIPQEHRGRGKKRKESSEGIACTCHRKQQACKAYS